MNSKYAHLRGVCFFFFVLFTSVSVRAIENGGFELYDYNAPPDFNTPTGWERTNYTAVVGSFAGRFFAQRYNWILDANIGLIPYEGECFVVLSTGDFLPEPNHAELRRLITINAGDRLTGAYFFGTNDWTPWNDWGTIQLVLPDTNTVVKEIVDVHVADVQSFRSMKGWKRFDCVFDANQAGDYDLKIFVSDYGDYIYNSYFAVDGLTICPQGPPFADINTDCIVGFQDFAMLANDWMCDCNNLEVFNDPNHNCVYGTDITENGLVDINDLQIMSDYWLEGMRQP
jgi:hypothetical protein